MKYDPATGTFYTGEDEFPNEDEHRFESAYYIRYNVDKALYAYEMLASYSQESEPVCFLCHVYTDLLFEACGMISKRFRVKKQMGDARHRQIEKNVREYGFNEDSFPLLSTSDFRNFIEHIDERGDYLITEDLFHGTFNVIYAGMDGGIRAGLTNTAKPQNSILNLEEMTYVILDRSGSQTKTIKLNELKLELDVLKSRADLVWRGLTEGGLFMPVQLLL